MEGKRALSTPPERCHRAIQHQHPAVAVGMGVVVVHVMVVWRYPDLNSLFSLYILRFCLGLRVCSTCALAQGRRRRRRGSGVSPFSMFPCVFLYIEYT